jgi:hypothetical protein
MGSRTDASDAANACEPGEPAPAQRDDLRPARVVNGANSEEGMRDRVVRTQDGGRDDTLVLEPDS